jgi:PAS domain S-box-containing protein
MSAPGDADSLLRRVADAVEAAAGPELVRSLVRSLAATLGVPYAFASELTCGGTHFRTRGLWVRGAFAADIEVPVAGTPCEAVLGGGCAHHAKDLQALFPDDVGLAEWGAESYLGVPIPAPDGRIIGHFAVFHERPLPEASPAIDVMRLFAARAGAELARASAEAELQASRERLQRVVDTAADGIVSYDAAGTLWLFNRAAERILRCPADDAIGTNVARFGSEEGLAAVANAIERLRAEPDALVFVGEEDRLPAVRADGTTFLQEASFSRGEAGGREFYTVIFRDVAERRQAGAELLERLREQNRYLREELAQLHDPSAIVGRSPALLRTLEEVARVAPTDASVLILGETGTGKELVARAIHAQSARRGRPLVKVNCAALSPGLVESELFGHEKGAFTGATEKRIGRFELAEGGTIFLDELGEIPLDVQVKLLRVLQEREFERVGSHVTQRANVRLIAATNRDLEAAIAAGRFRQDLFYRVNVFPVRVPPLRERRADVPLLAHFFAARHAARIGKRIDGISESTLARLSGYEWPGNVRELDNVIERAVILATGFWLEVPPEAVGRGYAASSFPGVRSPLPPEAAGARPSADSDSLDASQRRHIESVLAQTDWRIEGADGAAARLGLAASTLRSRMKKLGIRRERGGEAG